MGLVSIMSMLCHVRNCGIFGLVIAILLSSVILLNIFVIIVMFHSVYIKFNIEMCTDH